MNVATSCRDIKELNPLAQTACNLFLSECKRNNINIFITETYRSQGRQDYLYAQGRTRSGQIVTWTKKSNHTGRMAWDIACNGGNLYDKNMITKAGNIAKSLGITWGGSWKTPDMPHFEITSNWKSPIDVNKKPNTDGEEIMVKKYNNINEIPSYAKPTIQKLIDKKVFADVKNLNLTDDMLRIYVTHDRLGIYN